MDKKEVIKTLEGLKVELMMKRELENQDHKKEIAALELGLYYLKK